MRNKSNIKVLPLPSFWKMYGKMPIEDIIGNSVKIKQVFYRNGWYFDRINNKCWYEINDEAFETDSEQFKYEIELLNSRLLTKKEMEHIAFLIKQKLCPKSLKKLYWINLDIIDIKRVYRNSRKDCLHILKEIREK